MSEAVFRLESFSAPDEPGREALRRDELALAYRDGLAEGRAQGFSAELRALTEAIGALALSMGDARVLWVEAERQAVAGIMPALAEIIAVLAGRPDPAGLEAALCDEFLSLAGQATPPGWHILCPPAMEAMVRRAALAAGIDAPDIRGSAGEDEVSIILDQGRSAFSTPQVAQHFRDLLAELQEHEP